LNNYDILRQCQKRFFEIYEPVSELGSRIKQSQVNFVKYFGRLMDAPAVKNMEMWKVEALERTIDFRNGAFVNTGVGFNCTAVNTFLQDLQDRVCFDFLYDLEGY